MKKITVLSGANSEEKENRSNFYNFLSNSPIAREEVMSNLGLFLSRQTLSRILFMHELYQKTLNVHGNIAEFGVRWGQNLSLFLNFRGIHEPFNYNRKVIGFDTFEGFPNTHKNDGPLIKDGDYSVSPNYEEYLESVLDYHESESPISHKRKFELVKGDATKTFPEYLKNHPETIIALAYFDFDLYKPTKECLALLSERLTKGSVVAFDELNCPEFPGETLALMEVFGLGRYALKRSPLNPLISYLVIE